VTAAEFIGQPVTALESRRHQLWTNATRKPPARTGAAPAARATISQKRKIAKGGRTP